MSRVSEYVNTTLDIANEYYEVFGKRVSAGKMFCPFHDNTNTPAAKKYGNIIRCFTCNRSYTVYDLLSKFNVEKLNSIKQSGLIPEEENPQTNRIVKPFKIDRSLSLEFVVRSILIYYNIKPPC